MADEPIPKEDAFVSNWVSRSKPFREKGVERRQRDHMSRQFTYVMHGTKSSVPPHELEGSDIIHMGTPTSAHNRMVQSAGGHRYNHLYRISRDAMSPVVFGDYLNRPQNLEEPLQGVQEGLFESVPFDSNAAEEYQKESNLVLPYRNQEEDRGSISFTVPKSRIGSGVEYLGRWNSHRTPTPEEWEKNGDFYRMLKEGI